jgi:hypothetical protein
VAPVIKHRRNNADVVIDMGGGYGAAAFERLKDNGVEAYPFKGAEKAIGRTRDGRLGFTNRRTGAYWRLREALDPDQDGGSCIALPPNRKLAGQFTAVHFEMTINGIKAETKEEMVKRLGRSPDPADAVVMALYRGVTGSLRRQMLRTPDPRPQKPKVITKRNRRR